MQPPYKQVLSQWAVGGHDQLVYAFVFTVEGYDEPWFLVTTALDLSGEEVVESFTARFRQEDGFRDHKLCRARRADHLGHSTAVSAMGWKSSGTTLPLECVHNQESL